MIELNDISVAEYFELEDKSEYDFAIEFAFVFQQSKDEYLINDVTDLSFGVIKDIQDEIENGEMNFTRRCYWISKILNKEDESWIGKEKLIRFIIGSNYLINEIEKLINAERIVFTHEPTIEEEEAGLDRFNGLGIYLQLRKLAGNDVTKIEAVKQLPYSLCFTELFTMKQEYDFQKELNEIYKNKNRD